MPQHHSTKREHDESKTAQNCHCKNMREPEVKCGHNKRVGGTRCPHIFIFILCTDYNQQNHDEGDMPLLVMTKDIRFAAADPSTHNSNDTAEALEPIEEATKAIESSGRQRMRGVVRRTHGE